VNPEKAKTVYLKKFIGWNEFHWFSWETICSRSFVKLKFTFDFNFEFYKAVLACCASSLYFIHCFLQINLTSYLEILGLMFRITINIISKFYMSWIFLNWRCILP